MILGTGIVDPANVHKFLSKTGIQRANRFAVGVKLPFGSKQWINFMSDMVQVPSRSLNLRESHFSGVHSPIMTPIGFKTNATVFQILITEDWRTRNIFEYWLSFIYKYAASSSIPSDAGKGARIALLDEFKGQIFISALGIDGDVSAIYYLNPCFPKAILPAKFDYADLNMPLKYMVEIACADYTVEYRQQSAYNI